jgi:hypothetical protein
VGLVKVITAVVLLAVWLPATSHCLLEHALVIPKDECCPSEPSEKSGSVCCSLAAGNYKVEQADLVLFASTMRADTPIGFSTRISEPQITAGVPHYQSSWQFLQRTALPVRAPSIAS